VYAVRHASGLPMGQASSLREARQLIDEEIVLVRQRLAAAS
jgi:ribosomal protein S4